MAGIYIHIPFCRQACHYCDFHFSTNLSRQEEMVQRIAKELAKRKDFLKEGVETIYFGGGTPSLLRVDQLADLLETVYKHFDVAEYAEITLEANPEDLSSEYAESLYRLGINRLSIGIQTLDNHKLKWMNRVHSAEESLRAVNHARAAGFTNLSLDLIYALPDHGSKQWEQDLDQLVKLKPEHISLYGLTIEAQTVFGKWEKQKKLTQLAEDEAAKQYLFAVDYLKRHGYFQYEVSNFGKEGFYSRHNQGYWLGKPYLGVGPGAHSFDGAYTRYFNVRNNAKYLRALDEEGEFMETERLTHTQRINERILTELRTTRGIDLKQLELLSGQNLEHTHQKLLEELKTAAMIKVADGFLKLTPTGFLVADEIALRLFIPT